MSLNREECNIGYKKRHGRELRDEDYQAFLDLMTMFDVDADTYEEAFEKIGVSMLLFNGKVNR